MIVRLFIPSSVLILAALLAGNVHAQNAGLITTLTDQNSPADSFDTLDAEITLNEGILSYELGDYNTALQSFEPLRSTSSVAAQYCDLCYEQLSAGGSTGINQQFHDPLDCQTPEFSPRDSCQPAARPWNLTLLTGYQYDSNVSLSPNFVGLGAITNKADSGWYIASVGEYRLIEESDRNLGVIASTYDNFFFEQTNFNLQDYMGGFYANQVLGPNVFAGVRYEYHKTLLDDSSFSDEHRLVPNISFMHGDIGHTTVFYEFDALNFANEPLIPALDPSANVNAVGVTHAWYTFGGLGRIYVGYRFENASADGSDFDRSTNQINSRVEVPINCSLIVDGGFRYFWDDYENPNSLDFYGNPRRDERLEVRTGIQRIINRHLSARIDYRYINSDSNVANLFDVRFFDYSAHNLMVQLIYDF